MSPAPRTDPSLRDAGEIARELGADLERGLSSQEAARRLETEGPNELRAAPPVPKWKKLLAQLRDPLVYLLLVAVVVSLAVWALRGADEPPVDAIVIAVIVVANAVLGYVQGARAEQAVAALKRMTAATSAVVRDGELRRVPSAELVRGDLLVLGEGDAVGADARLVQAAALRVQEASLTGESEAVLKDPATLREHVALGDRTAMVWKGTAVTQGTGRAIVTATGMSTQMGAIATMLERAKAEETPLQREIAHVGRMLGLAVIVIAAIVVGTVFATSDVESLADAVQVLLLGVSLAVAAVPEGLPAILSVVLALGVQRMAKHRAIVKELSSVETLGSASVICSDKTGTLTRAEMTIERVTTASGSARVTGIGYTPKGRVEDENSELVGGPLHAEDIVVLSGGALASDAELHERDGEWTIEGDPTEAAFLVAEHKLGAHERRKKRFARVAVVPFTSERKRMSTIERDHEHGDELVLITKGAPDVLLERCTRVRVGMDAVALDEAWRTRIVADVDALTDDALRTLSVAYRPLATDESARADESLEHDLIFVGTVGIIDPPRAEAGVAVHEARRAGIRVLMITGDHPRTALRIATDLGIAEPGARALTGNQLESLDEAALRGAVHATSVYARVAPEHKLRIVDALQAEGNVVAMTGDGVNDAPALKSADIGIAMGVTGTEVTKEAAKMILADDNFATIVRAVREGRGIFDNIRKFLRYLLSSNMGEVLTVFFGVVLADVIGLRGAGDGVVVPLLATQILWINLVTDSGPALAMGVDPETDDVMARPPRPLHERVIDRRMWAGVLLVGAVMAFATLLAIDLHLPGGLFDGAHALERARTAGFTTLVLAQLFNCFNARSEDTSAFRHLFVNPWLWGAVVLGVVLQIAVVELPFLQHAFGTEPLTLVQWLLCAGLASLVLWVSELRKLLARRSR
ncbi:cation-translocating P-type ATPase [Sandaracinus amylolyticus]|uniref:cation-translocating P-type ATPase n=1 Tax=Sandaracinus amylolyticus TaxID=927083 RepID=UPI001F2A82E1|nr:cation-translocating P-type ATPase [Sandaracinus amylolyticus]UJR85031.1 Hypothetical protein I5071_71100 [Sandaracinus amylolyticus]